MSYKLFTTQSAADLGERMAKMLDRDLGRLYTTRFADGEAFVRFDESIRGESVVLLSRVNMPYENLFELFLAVDAARRASAQEIICMVPYLPHSRQERKDNDRAPVAARLMADFFEKAGAHRVITLDMHTTAIEGFYSIPVDHLDTMNLFAPHIREHFASESLTLCSPDFGGLKRVKQYRKVLDCDMIVIDKERKAANQVAKMELIGDAAGRDIVIVDDMVDTAGTLCRAADHLKAEGAKSVSAYCTHGLLSKDAVQKIEASALDRLYIADTLRTTPEAGKIRYISCAGLLGEALDNLSKNKSLRALNEPSEAQPQVRKE